MEPVKRNYIRKVAILTLLLAAIPAATGLGLAVAFGQESPADSLEQLQEEVPTVRWDLAVAVSVSIAIPCLAAAYAVARVGAAALGAASENPELLTRSLLFVALAEGIAIYGLLIAVLLYTKL